MAWLIRPLTGLLALALAFAAGCGGGGDALTLEEYFDEVLALSETFDAEGSALEEQFNAENPTTDEERIELAEEFFNEALTVLEEFVGGFEDLDPPPETEAAHEETVSAGNAAIDSLHEIIDQVGEAETQAELEELFVQFLGTGTAFDTFSKTCFSLQEIADDEGIDVDLLCGE
jgi:hypothetical protein